jgi:uncharacterized membrane protein YccC
MSPGQWLRGLIRSIVAFDRTSLEFGFALRCTVGVAIPLVVACALGHPQAGFAPAIGALIGGFTSLQGIYRSRMIVVLAVAIGVAFFSFLGGLAAPSLAALLLLSAFIGYMYGTVAQLGMPAGVAALQVVVAFVIFSSLPLTPRQDLVQSALLLAGCLIQALLLAVVWPIDRQAIERRGLAAAYRELADYAQALTKVAGTAPPIGALATARQIAADQQPLARSSEIARFKRVLGEAEAMRHRLGALMALHSGTAGPGVGPLAEAIAEQLRALAATLEGTIPIGDLEAVRVKTLAAYEAFERDHRDDPFALALVRDIAAHLRDATQGVAVASTGRPVRMLFSAAPRPSAYIRTKIDWASRDAIRIAVVLTLAMLLGHTLFSATRGYWIALTVALVLRPDLQSTIFRGFARIAGTLLGAVIAVLAIVAAHGDPVWQSVVLVGAAAVSYLTLMPNYTLFSTAITVFVIVAMALHGAGKSGTVSDRIVDTLVGGTLAMLGYLAFPSWVRRRTRPLLADVLDSQRAFAATLLEAYAEPQRVDRSDIGELRTICWQRRTEVEAAIDLARAEPKRPHTIDTDRAIAILAAVQTFSLSSMALESGLETMPPPPPLPELEPFRAALDRTMHELAEALREDRPPVVDDTLPKLYLELSHAADAEHPTSRFVLEYAAGYVQSIEALAAYGAVRATGDAVRTGI